MAKSSTSIVFKNAVICKKDNTITEVNKDDTCVYSLSKLIERWDGIEGLSISIKKDNDVCPDGEDDRTDG